MEDYLDLGHHLAQLYHVQAQEHIPRQIRDRLNPIDQFGDDDFLSDSDLTRGPWDTFVI